MTTEQRVCSWTFCGRSENGDWCTLQKIKGHISQGKSHVLLPS